ncbi:Uncharacterized protein dnm_020940 [Desulfonema magnum]|uniref:Uncharacterized protein n=1 Tax=Desulfonema magnum TaxID=45655 RepID=A0A975BIQ1_9BACT|nr:Uncharacterized protein dnm_020940 [Desulfonema magnum]
MQFVNAGLHAPEIPNRLQKISEVSQYNTAYIKRQSKKSLEILC